MQGRLIVRVLDLDGNELSVYETPNVITDGAKAIITKLLVPASSADQDDNQIWYLKAGDGTTTPDATDTDVAGSNTYAKPFDTMVYNSGGTDGLIECTVTFGTGEGNVLAVGEYFTEAGLFTRGSTTDPVTTAGSTMCARQLHAQVHKDSSIQLQYTWLIQFTPAP